MSSSKFQEHLALLTSFLPELSGVGGFLFYSFLAYLVVLFFGWLLNPSVDKFIERDLKEQKQRHKGMTMRKKNQEEAKADRAKAENLAAKSQ